MSFGSPKWRPWILDEQASRPIIAAALEQGINYFDTANVYSLGASEEVLGRALKDMARREQVVISTKIGAQVGVSPTEGGLSRKHVIEAVNASLRRLGTEYVDLVLVHRLDYATPFEEWLEAIDRVIKAGKALYFGISSMHTWQFAKALFTAKYKGWTVPTTMQPQYNAIYREEEKELFPLCADQGIAITPWSPLARGLLADTQPTLQPISRATTDEMMPEYNLPSDLEIRDALKTISLARQIPMAQIAMAWVLKNPLVTSAIIGVENMGHLDTAIAALSTQLSPEDISALETPYRPRAIIGHT